jgi:DNA-binding NtrC family response regulator
LQRRRRQPDGSILTAANLRVAGQPQLAQRILIVDDDESMRRMIAEVLSAAGYAVSEASTGKQALRLLTEQDIQLVLTELVMPETEGLQLIQQMHKAEPDVRVIAMSGSPRAATYLSVARALGARAALHKPLPVDQLLQTIHEVLAAP